MPLLPLFFSFEEKNRTYRVRTVNKVPIIPQQVGLRNDGHLSLYSHIIMNIEGTSFRTAS